MTIAGYALFSIPFRAIFFCSLLDSLARLECVQSFLSAMFHSQFWSFRFLIVEDQKTPTNQTKWVKKTRENIVKEHLAFGFLISTNYLFAGFITAAVVQFLFRLVFATQI